MCCKAFCIVTVTILVAVCLDIYFFLDLHRHFFKHHPGECKRIEGSPFGSEDFQILSSGLAFVSSGLATKHSTPEFWDFVNKNNVKGQILLIDLTAQKKTVKELNIKPSEIFDQSTFRPHGLSVLEDKVKGQHLIYVVNHILNEIDRIEKFKFLPETGELEHMTSFSSDFMHKTNDLALTGEDNFYFTNLGYFDNKFLGIVEGMLRLRINDLGFYNGTHFTVSVSRLSGPNGVMVSKDGRYVYLALCLEKAIQVYERSSDNSLKMVQDINLGTVIDNLHLSENGDALYSGNHPKVFELTKSMDDPTLRAPSQVLRFPLKNGLIEEDEISEIFYDHGDIISASSVAAVYQNKLYIGSVMDTLVTCDMPN